MYRYQSLYNAIDREGVLSIKLSDGPNSAQSTAMCCLLRWSPADRQSNLLMGQRKITLRLGVGARTRPAPSAVTGFKEQPVSKITSFIAWAGMGIRGDTVGTGRWTIGVALKRKEPSCMTEGIGEGSRIPRLRQVTEVLVTIVTPTATSRRSPAAIASPRVLAPWQWYLACARNLMSILGHLRKPEAGYISTIICLPLKCSAEMCPTAPLRPHKPVKSSQMKRARRRHR